VVLSEYGRFVTGSNSIRLHPIRYSSFIDLGREVSIAILSISSIKFSKSLKKNLRIAIQISLLTSKIGNLRSPLCVPISALYRLHH